MLCKMKKEGFLVIGMLSITISIVLNIYFEGIPVIDFLEGMLSGISVVMNATFLYKFGRDRRLRDNNVKVQDVSNWIKN
jgi:hypothetical protein